MFNNFFNFFDIMNNFGVASTSKLIKQESILEWLQQLSINDIKTIVEIKNPKSKLIVEKLIRNNNYKKQDVLKIGFNETTELDFYYRPQYRYKKEKQKKKLVSQQLYQNITISRGEQCAINISKDYLENGKLKQAMMLLSDGQLFYYIKRKQFHSFAEWVTHLFEIEISEAYAKKKRFKFNIYNFITEYPLEQIQTELKKAIINVLSKGHKSINTNDPALKEKCEQEKKYMFGKCWDRIQAEGRFVVCEYSWLQEDRDGQFAHIMDEMHSLIYSHFHDYLIQQEIKDIQKFQTDLNKNNSKKKKKKAKKKPNQQQKESKQEKAQQSEDQTLTLDKEKLKIEKSIQIIQLKKWEGPYTQPNKLQDEEQNQKKQKLKQQHSQVISLESNSISKASLSIKQSEKKSQDSSLNNSNNQKSKQQGQNTKKKYKAKGKNVRLNGSKQNQYLDSPNQEKSEQYTDSTSKLEGKDHKKIEQSSQKDNQKEQSIHTTKTKQYEQYYPHDKTSEMSQQSQMSADYLKLKPKSKSLSKQSIVGVSMKKIDRKIQEQNKKQKQLQNILDSALQNYADSLIQESIKFQQTRETAIELIKQFLQHQQIKSKWELVTFGSVQNGISLKQSDIDLVLRIENQKVYTLKDMCDGFRSLPWILEFQHISSANFPIISLKINLYQVRKLSKRLLKKLDKCIAEVQDIWQYAEDFIVTVDISMCGLNEQYGGVVSTNNLRFLFLENLQLKKMIFILKDLLRRKWLNKPYFGGINSYPLAMMTYGIIKTKQLELKKSQKVENQYVTKKKKDYAQGLKQNLYVGLCQISNFLNEFVPFQTLINPHQEKITFQSPNHLNIVDPFSKKLIKVGAFRINDVIEVIQSFKMFMDGIKEEIKGGQFQNSKKFKFQIYEKIIGYIKQLKPQLDVYKQRFSEDFTAEGEGPISKKRE